MERTSPLTLQLAARVERTNPPPLAEIGAAAALATLSLLADERAAPGGDWYDAVTAWNGARIRKLVRRARGVAWEQAQTVPGVSASVGAASVRAFVPGPQTDAPPVVRKLQIQGAPLAAPIEIHRLPSVGADTMVLAVTPEPWMTWGKQAAQCAHGAQRLVERQPPPPGWLEHPKILVVHPCPVLWNELAAYEPVEIRDGGHTEIPADTLTLRAQWHPETRRV